MDIQEPLKLKLTVTSDTEKMEPEKNIKSDLQSECENQNDPCFIDELPSEVLTKILQCLNVKSLLDSRLVSRKWNGVAREILKSRDDVETVFSCEETEDGNFEIVQSSQGGSLEIFSKCFEDSKESPLYTRFRFRYIEPIVFDHVDWLQFISCFGPSIKCLKFRASVTRCDVVHDAGDWAGKLRNLLWNQVPNLEEIGLDFHVYDGRNLFPSFGIPPVPKPTTTSGEETTAPTPTSTEETRGGVAPLQLPNLKVLYLSSDSFSHYTGIVTDILSATVKLQKIELAAANLCSVDSLFLLQSLGKLGCLQNASIVLDEEFLKQIKEQSKSKSKNSSSLPLEFKLKKLEILRLPIIRTNNKALWADASAFLSQLFESSKDTLTELQMDSFGLLKDPPLPKFSKLTHLFIDGRGNQGFAFFQKLPILPSGLDLKKIFPALQNLVLPVPWTRLFRHDEKDSCLPNLRSLKIKTHEITTEHISRISRMCPNLKILKIGCGFESRTINNFPKVVRAICTHMTQLESLRIFNLVRDPVDALPALDSCFTGFSQVECSRLHSLTEVGEYGKIKWYQNLIAQFKSKPASENQLEDAERKSPSILDLKGLTNLELFFVIPRADPHLANIFLKVSEKNAFQLMENLKYNIRKTTVSSFCYLDERN